MSPRSQYEPGSLRSMRSPDGETATQFSPVFTHLLKRIEWLYDRLREVALEGKYNDISDLLNAASNRSSVIMADQQDWRKELETDLLSACYLHYVNDPSQQPTGLKRVLYGLYPFKYLYPVQSRLFYFLQQFSCCLDEYVTLWLEQDTKSGEETKDDLKRDYEIDPAVIVYLYQMMMHVLYIYRARYPIMQISLIQPIFPKILRLLQFSGLRKATSPWYVHLPDLPLLSLKCEQPQRVLGIMRHEVDLRYDERPLHAKEEAAAAESQRIMRKFCSAPLKALSGAVKGLKDGLLCEAALTATYPWVSRAYRDMLDKSRESARSEKATGAKEFTSPETEAMNRRPQPKDNAMTLKFNPRPSEDEDFLYNDPNADGFLMTIGQGLVLGAVADGSGTGHQARLAANLVLAVMYDLLIEDVKGDPEVKEQNEEESKLKRIKLKIDPLQLKTSHDVFKLIAEITLTAQRVMVSTHECGAATVALYVLKKLDTDTVMTQDLRTNYNTCNSLRNPEQHRDAHVMMYMVAGDIESIMYDSKVTRRWKSLFQPPQLNDKIRVSASITPGGIGKKHGDAERIWGAFMWRDAGLALSSTTNLRSYYLHANNLHFGQAICYPGDCFIFSSDGLGDTLDPAQLYPRPYLIPGLQKYDTWTQFHHSGLNQQFISQDLKELALNRILKKAMSTTSVDLTSSTTTASRSAKLIMEACVEHAMYATSGHRRLYNEVDFLKLSDRAKQEKVDERMEEWIGKNWVPVKNNGPEVASTRRASDVHAMNFLCVKGSYIKREYRLPERQFVPFAKVDHLGIQVFQVELAQLSGDVSEPVGRVEEASTEKGIGLKDVEMLQNGPTGKRNNQDHA